MNVLRIIFKIIKNTLIDTQRTFDWVVLFWDVEFKKNQKNNSRGDVEFRNGFHVVKVLINKGLLGLQPFAGIVLHHALQ